ncbi:unnamed protein product, partial [Cyprideis torosa]
MMGFGIMGLGSILRCVSSVSWVLAPPQIRESHPAVLREYLTQEFASGHPPFLSPDVTETVTIAFPCHNLTGVGRTCRVSVGILKEKRIHLSLVTLTSCIPQCIIHRLLFQRG